MRLDSTLWLGTFLLASLVTAQDVNAPQFTPSTPYNRYDVNGNPSSTSNPYDINPYTQDSQNNPYGTRPNDPFGTNDPYGRGDPYGQGGTRDPYGQGDANRDRAEYDPFGGRSQSPSWRNDLYGGGRTQLDAHSTVIREATYFVVASKMVRPGQLYRVSVTVLKEKQPLTVRASIQRNDVEMSADHKDVKEGIPETLLMRVPSTSAPGEYKLRVEGLYDDVLGGAQFINETKLIFSQRSMTIFVQLDKPVYMQGETVRFRTIPINTELKAFSDAVDVFMLDPNGHIMKRWLSRQSNLGTVSLDYKLSDQPVFGEWKIRVIAQSQVEESTFLVEEYYQTRFEVNVTMPAFFLNTEPYIYGTVMANYTSGGPVHGNLTLKATVRPIRPIDPNKYIKKTRRRPDDQNQFYDPNRPYDVNNPYDANVPYDRPYDGVNRPYDDYDRIGSYNRPIVEKYFTFNEELPFWMKMPENYYDPIPHMRMFKGVYQFRYPIQELLHYVPTLEGMEVVITATVGDRFLDEVIEGYSTARIFNSSINLRFLGDSPQVFKPGMPVTTYIIASYQDGSPLSRQILQSGVLEVTATVDMRGGGRRDIPSRILYQMEDNQGVWEYKVDVKRDLGITGPKAYEELSQLSSLRIHATFRDAYSGQLTNAELLMLAHYSFNDQHIKVITSTITPKVGEYMIFHIRSNYYVEKFNYLIISKGIVLLTGDQDMGDYVSTMAIALSAEMAPVATIVIWNVGRYGDLQVDSLTFPVNGISRNKFKVFINNKKARTGHKVEVAIYGEPGSYVGLSGIDRSFYTMQAGNELTYAKVISKMSTFDEQTNSTLQHTWFSHEGNPDELIYFPSSTYGIDANRTFEYAGLVVFSDFELPRRPSFCNASMGYGECLNGQCYRLAKKCDFYRDCEDGTDEAGCHYDNGTQLQLFRKFRFNRIQRQYENVWVWKDVNIGPHGRYIFNIPVPPRPAHWMISAFSMSPSLGFGMLTKAIEYVGVLPFFINVEMPSVCMQGEQVGVRVTVFNYMTDNMEATVVLNGSPDYKFVHVEENGIVRAYNPRTSFGEHQFFIFILLPASFLSHPFIPGMYFRNQSTSSVWLTAYCARVFQEASFYEWENYIYIDPVVIAKAVEWVLKHQNEYGAFWEESWLPDRKYNSSLNIENDPIRHRNITLTAHVLIMLDSVKDLTSGLSSKVAIAAKRAIHWLERNMELLKEKGSPFEVAIVAYALMKAKAPNAETAFLELSRRQRFEGGLLYWGRDSIPQPPYKIENQKPFLLPRLPYEYDSENIEATAYALLVYVARQEIYVDNIVRWLNTQRLTDGGWASTSDTANAMKALIEYTSAQRIRDISSLSVTVEATALPGKTQVMYVNDRNRAHLQYVDIPNAWGTVKVQGKGTGYAILQMSVQYNVDVERFQTKPPVPAFDLWTKQYFYGRNQSHITYVSCQKWTHLNESERSGMAILDVTIPTGYIIQQQDLDAYILSRRVRNLQRAKFLERKVLFYFDYLDSEQTCINFTVERWYPVANMSRYLPIRVYDYYAPGESTTAEYINYNYSDSILEYKVGKLSAYEKTVSMQTQTWKR
nr:CD109 antigen [Leptinotarsa decemlineata]